MTIEELYKLEVCKDLVELIPNWRDVDLTKAGYNEQYIKTLLNVAIYITEREQKLIKKLMEEL